MLSNNQIKEITSLQHKKYRQKYDKFVVEGHKSSVEFLRSGKFSIYQIFALDSWVEMNQNEFQSYSNLIHPVSEKEMGKLSMLKTATDIMMVCKKPSFPVNLQLNGYSQIIYLDRIQDPGNFGTIIRIADWFGIKLILTSRGTVDIYNPKVIQASMGSICNMDFMNINLEEIDLGSLPHTIIGADIKGSSLKGFEWPGEFILVLGNEGAGIGEENTRYIDQWISIEGSNDRIADSLNVANAMAILGYSIFSK